MPKRQVRAFDPPVTSREESAAARLGRFRAQRRAEQRRRRRGHVFQLPRGYHVPRLLPGELPGHLTEEYVRCGNTGCACAGVPVRRAEALTEAQQGALHGPYLYRRWREDGRQRKAYVAQAEAEEVRARVEHRRRRLQADRVALWQHMRRGRFAWKRQIEERAASLR